MKTKKLVSLLLLLVMTAAMFLPSRAANVSGQLGDSVTWSYDAANKTILISGSGATYDYQLDKSTYKTDSPLESYCFTAEKVVVEEGVTYLGKYIFYASNRSEIHIPKSVTKIDGKAFGTIFDFDNTHVYYAGTEAEWNALDRGYDFYFEEAIMHYGTTGSNANVSAAPVINSSTANAPVQVPASASLDGIKVYIDNAIVSFDVQPRLIGGRTMVPLRAIFEGLGATVEWNGPARTITAYNEVTIVKAVIDDYEMTVNGAKKTMDVPPMIVEDRTLVPARFVAEAFNCDVAWDGNTQSVYITTKPLDYSKVEPETTVKPEDGLSSDTTTVPSKPTDKETVKSGKPYKVDFFCDTNIYYTTYGNGAIYYTDEGLKKIYKLDMNTGEDTVYCDLEDWTVSYNGESWKIDYFRDIEYNRKNNAIVLTSVKLTQNNPLSGKTNEVSYFAVDITNRKVLFRLNNYVLGILSNGDIMTAKSFSGSTQWTYNLKYPKYETSEKEESSYFLSMGDASTEYGFFQVGGEDLLFNSEAIYRASGGNPVVETYGNAIGANSKNIFMINDTTVFKLSPGGTIIDSYSLEDVEVLDDMYIYNEMNQLLYVTEDESIIFYDEDMLVFRKISKNNHFTDR